MRSTEIIITIIHVNPRLLIRSDEIIITIINMNPILLIRSTQNSSGP